MNKSSVDNSNKVTLPSMRADHCGSALSIHARRRLPVNLQKEICAAFCDGLIVREVPVGYAISTPVTWFSGDTLSFYARVENGRARLEDSGSLLFDLEGQGVDFSSENRMEILSGLMAEHGVILSEEDGLFCTEWVQKSDIAKLALPFLTFLARVQDLLFLNRVCGTIIPMKKKILSIVARALGVLIHIDGLPYGRHGQRGDVDIG